MRLVKEGRLVDGLVEMLTGLSAGERVIMSDVENI
jgi:hypothetical protein